MMGGVFLAITSSKKTSVRYKEPLRENLQHSTESNLYSKNRILKDLV